MYLEACAMLPQIYMFQTQASSQGGIVEVNRVEPYPSIFSDRPPISSSRDVAGVDRPYCICAGIFSCI